MAQQNFAKCPFCVRVFDFQQEVTTKLIVDGSYRYACSTCSRKYGLANIPVETMPPDGKPNGGLIHRAPAE